MMVKRLMMRIIAPLLRMRLCTVFTPHARQFSNKEQIAGRGEGRGLCAGSYLDQYLLVGMLTARFAPPALQFVQSTDY
jgi:hypothetical protein